MVSSSKKFWVLQDDKAYARVSPSSGISSIGIWPRSTKSIWLSLRQHKTCSGSSSGFWACFHERKQMFESWIITKDPLVLVRFTYIYIVWSFWSLPGWLSQDQEFHSSVDLWMLQVLSVICSWIDGHPNQSQSSLDPVDDIKKS